ncbi:MAG TPA: DNA translocase FtsK 4TM domain-containing protein, partial [Candidatus Kapabacteria bacterium]|nr:DNA translocase FtsK 4TM domain-containing protein [Candidatus Kapabacteria bacterium]
MAEEFDAPDSPFIRIARNGEVTKLADTRENLRSPRRIVDDARPSTFGESAYGPEEYEEFESSSRAFDSQDVPLTPRPRGARPMPKRLSEEAREAAEAEEYAAVERLSAPLPAAPKKSRTSRSTKAQQKKEAEQIPLPLKSPKPKPDSMVRQRQVLGFCCIVAAILVLLAIISYSPDDAPRAETKISDLPALFLPHADGADKVRDAVRANADQAKNWLGLIGAMLADFLINKTIGYAAILYPIFFGAWSLAFFRFTYKQRRRLTLATTFFLITAILFSATAGTASNFVSLPREWSGSVGQFLGLAFARLIGTAGAFIIYTSAFVIMLVFSIDLDIERTFLRLKGWWSMLVMYCRRKIIEFWEKREVRQLAREERRAEEEAAERQAEEEAALREAEEQQTSIGIAETKPEILPEENPAKEEPATVSPKPALPIERISALAE